jgi:hypothetical protein
MSNYSDLEDRTGKRVPIGVGLSLTFVGSGISASGVFGIFDCKQPMVLVLAVREVLCARASVCVCVWGVVLNPRVESSSHVLR